MPPELPDHSLIRLRARPESIYMSKGRTVLQPEPLFEVTRRSKGSPILKMLSTALEPPDPQPKRSR
ncbi:hypothetical protein M728_001237 [Ensifer sp. WSM1721]